jgi:hypothetical protein
MVATSSQHSGTATTTSAGPNPKPHQHVGGLVVWRNLLAQQVFAGDAKVDLSIAQVLGDFGGGEEGDFDTLDPRSACRDSHGRHQAARW